MTKLLDDELLICCFSESHEKLLSHVIKGSNRVRNEVRECITVLWWHDFYLHAAVSFRAKLVAYIGDVIACRTIQPVTE